MYFNRLCCLRFLLLWMLLSNDYVAFGRKLKPRRLSQVVEGEVTRCAASMVTNTKFRWLQQDGQSTLAKRRRTASLR